MNKICPTYLTELLLFLVSERTNYSLHVSSSNYSLISSCTKLFKRSFFPSTTKLWNDTSLDIPYFNSIGSSLYNFGIDRKNAIIHTQLRLDTCPLNYYLFKMGCRESPVCSCDFT